MLAKKHRLAAPFFKAGASPKNRLAKSYPGPFFSARIFSSVLPYGRFAVVASSAAFKKAVWRNKLRRMVYNEIENSGLKEIAGIDCVIYLKPDAKDASCRQIAESLEKIFESVKK